MRQVERGFVCALVPAVAGAVAAPGAPAVAGEGPNVAIENVVVRTLATDYAWGLWSGVKQPLGAVQRGLNIHQITKSNFPAETGKGNPDYLLWVDEAAGTYGISERPTGGFAGNVTNPGGMAVFDEQGTIWYTIGGRASDLPLDLFRSEQPYDVGQFVKVLDDYETFAASTTPCVHVRDGKVMLVWRHGWSSSPETTVRFRRYDVASGFDRPELELDVGRGAMTASYDDVGIEQLYTRYDPRAERLLVSWQWFDHPGPMGTNPFVQSADFGATWMRADEAPYADLPLDFNAADETTSPYDHIFWKVSTDWLVADIGIAPGGTPWMTTPRGTPSVWRSTFWRYDAADGWQGHDLMGRMLLQAKPHACGVTRDFLVFAYAERAEPDVLKARVSGDDGATWGPPVVLDRVPTGDSINWISLVQPSDGYPGNRIRFFYSHFETKRGITAQRHQNSIRWVGLDVLTGDLNGDGVVDFGDLLLILASWGPCAPCIEDINGDGEVGFFDLVQLLSLWG